MAKKDNNSDETPMEFYVPGPGYRGSKVPIPINQPHWIYKKENNSKPNAFEWFMSCFFIIFGITTTTGNILSTTKSLPLLLISMFFLIVGLANLQRLFVRNQKFKSDPEIIQPKKSKEKKQPKRRKDFK